MKRPPLHLLTLRFINPAVEQDYLTHDFPRLVSQGRISCLIAMVCYLTLGFFFDHELFPPEAMEQVWQIRLTALLVPLTVLLLSFHPLFRRVNYLPLALIGLAGGLGLIAMSQHLPPDRLALYYPALIPVVFFTYNLTGTRFVYATAVDIALFTTYNLAALARPDFPPMTLGLHDFDLGIANLIGGAAGYLTEQQRRLLFFSELKLRSAVENAEAARHEADQANEAKSRFLAAVSHDLRQPIHAQGLFLDALRQTTLTSKQQELAAHIGATSEATGQMLHTLMDYSRIDSGVIQPQPRAFALQPLLNRIEREFMPLADARGLAYRSRETRLAVFSDPALIEMILRNLVANAIRYTERGGLLLACRKRGNQVALSVIDTGIGIEASAQEAVFKEFHQLGNPERERTKGLGLGLAIVKGLALCLGHPLGLRSIPGRGSCFEILLPLADAASVTAQPTTLPALAQPQGLRILLVEDNAAVRAGTRELLLGWGFTCDAVEDLAPALAVAREHAPSLVICDFRLREHRTGLQVIASLRAELGCELPALLITGDTAPDRIRQAQASGIPMLHKPVVPTELYRQIVSLLDKQPGLAMK